MRKLFERNENENFLSNSVILSDQCNRHVKLTLSDDDLSRHLLLIGEPGSGKTNVFNLIMDQIKTEKMVIFDPKGDFKEAFFRQGIDHLIGSSSKDRFDTKYWNIFREIEFSDPFMNGKMLTMKELANAFFVGRKNLSQPYFTDAAKAIFYMILERQMKELWMSDIYIEAQKIIEKRGSTHEQVNNALCIQKDLFESMVHNKLNNSILDKIIKNATVSSLRELLGKGEDANTYDLTTIEKRNRYGNSRIYGYLGKGAPSPAAVSVVGELQVMYFEVFQETLFAKYEENNDIALCDFINNGQGRLFIEYDISTASAMGPIYKALIDMALKTQMSNFRRTQNKCYFFIDELKLVPKLVHLDNACNFGRSLGVRIIAGIQSIVQLNEVYGAYTSSVILDGFSNIFAFPLSAEVTSREYVVNRLGQKRPFLQQSQMRECEIVDEQTILQLKCGQAICKTFGKLYPFIFCFEEFIKK